MTAIEAFVDQEWVAEVPSRGEAGVTAVAHDGTRVELRMVPLASFGNLLQHLTGSKEHNVAIREDAVRTGLKVSEYGIEDIATGEVFATARRGRGVQAAGDGVDPAGAAREPGRAEGGPRGHAARS